MMKSNMTPQDFIAVASTLYDGHGWQARLAREIGVSIQTPSNWAHGRHPIPAIVEAYLKLKLELIGTLKEKDINQLELFDNAE